MLMRTSFPSDSYYLREKPFAAAAAQEYFPLSLSLSWGCFAGFVKTCGREGLYRKSESGFVRVT